MKPDFRHHLLLQIEMLRGTMSHEEFSARLGDITERSLAAYLAGKSHLQEAEFRLVAEALNIDPQILAQAWACSLGLRTSGRDVAGRMIRRAYQRWQQHSRVARRGVPSRPSPMAVIRAKYADRFPREPPPLWFGSYGRSEKAKDTPANRARFTRAYEMLVECVHDCRSHRDIGASRGISGERARQLMTFAAYTWARTEKIDLSKKSVPFKNEAKLVQNLYAALRFFARYQFNVLAEEQTAERMMKKTGGTK